MKSRPEDEVLGPLEREQLMLQLAIGRYWCLGRILVWGGMFIAGLWVGQIGQAAGRWEALPLLMGAGLACMLAANAVHWDVQARRSAVMAVRRGAAALAWNSRPLEERRVLLAQASAAREEWSRVEAQLSATDDAEVRSRLGRRQRELLAFLSAVPRKCDPVTLEAAR